MGLRRIVALSATVGVLGIAGAAGTAGVASAAEQTAPSAYGYVAGTTGGVISSWTGGKNLLSAAAPVAPSFDPAAKVPGNAAASVAPFTVDLPLNVELTGGAGALAVDTTANPTTGVSTAKASGATGHIGLRMTVEKLVDSIYDNTSNDVVKRILRGLKAAFADVKAEVKLSFSGFETRCQAGPAGTAATGDGSLATGGLTILVPGVNPIEIPFDSHWVSGKLFDLPGFVTAGTKVVHNLPDGGISVDAVSVNVLGQSANLGHVECHPGVPAGEQ